jgi:D-alanine-D-alanine ligase-like ATP-grasp enzyme
LPIMGLDDEIITAYLEEPLFNTQDFFDFDTKYMGQGKGGKMPETGAKQGAQGYSRIPADFDKELYDKAEKVAVAAYKAVGCNGTARVDILINSKTGAVYFNEINPLPGSLYAHNWRAKGVSGVDLVEKLIYFALKRYTRISQLNTTFSTNFLKQF